MAKQTVQPKKRRGPAPTGKGTPIQVRLQPAQLKALDAWIAKQSPRPTRPEAIREMIAAEIVEPHHFKLPEKTEKHAQDQKTGRRE
jgi:hypothetical protein